MNKIFTLNKNGDFLALYHRGKSKAHPLIITYVGSRNLGRSKKKRNGNGNSGFVQDHGIAEPKLRIGITASKKIGNAVMRNRARRIIKEAFRLIQPEIKPSESLNIVFVARQAAVEASMWQVYKAMKGHLKTLGVLKPSDKPNKPNK